MVNNQIPDSYYTKPLPPIPTKTDQISFFDQLSTETPPAVFLGYNLVEHQDPTVLCPDNPQTISVQEGMDTQYLHANEVTSLDGSKTILAQAPGPKSQNIFWKAVFERGGVLLDLQHFFEKSENDLPYPTQINQFMLLGDLTLTCENKESWDENIVLTLKIKNEVTQQEKSIKVIHHQTWEKDKGIEFDDLDELIELVDTHLPPDQNLFAISTLGVGRPAEFVVARSLKHQITQSKITGAELHDRIKEEVLLGRAQRGPHFIQTAEQLKNLEEYSQQLISNPTKLTSPSPWHTEINKLILKRIQENNIKAISNDLTALISLSPKEIPENELIALSHELEKTLSPLSNAISREVYQAVLNALDGHNSNVLLSFAKLSAKFSKPFLKETGYYLINKSEKGTEHVVNNYIEYQMTMEDLKAIANIVLPKSPHLTIKLLNLFKYLNEYEFFLKFQKDLYNQIVNASTARIMDHLSKGSIGKIAGEIFTIFSSYNYPLTSEQLSQFIHGIDFLASHHSKEVFEQISKALCIHNLNVAPLLDPTLPPNFRAEAAKAIVTYSDTDAKLVLENVELLKTLSMEDRIQIAKTAAKKFPVLLVDNLKNLDIEDKAVLLEIAALAARGNHRNKAYMYVISHLSDFQITDDKVPKLKKIFDSQSPTHHLREVIFDKAGPFAVGAAKPGAATLHPYYWKETLDLKIKVGNEIFEGHIYPNTQPMDDAKVLWAEAKDIDGIAFRKKFSFEEYLNIIFIPSLTTEEKELFINELKTIKYLSPFELSTLNATISADGVIHMATPYLADFTQKVLEQNSDQTYSEYLHSMLHSDAERPRNILLPPEAQYIFVLTPQGQLRLGLKEKDIKHSSLAEGQALLSAGFVKCEVKDGTPVIKEVHAYSGHYQPTFENMIPFVEYLEKQNVNISEIDFYVESKKISGDQMLLDIRQRKKQFLKDLKHISLGAYNLAKGLDPKTGLINPEKVYSYHQLKAYSEKAMLVHAPAIDDLAKAIYPFVEQVMIELGYPPEKLKNISKIFASSLYYTIDQSVHYAERVRKGHKLTIPMLIPDRLTGIQKIGADFTFHIETDPAKKVGTITIIPDKATIKDTVLGEGSYKKSKKSYRITVPLTHDYKTLAVETNRKVIQRSKKGSDVVKTIQEGMSTQEKMLKDLDPEAKIVPLPVVTLYTAKSGKERVELEQDWYPSDLHDAIQKKKIPIDFTGTTTKTIHEENLLNYILNVAVTTAAIHKRGVIHHDLKSQNILIAPDQSAWLGDVDLMRQMGKGVPYNITYWDRVTKQGFVSPASDIYGLGILLGEAFLPDFGQIEYNRDLLLDERGAKLLFVQMIEKKLKEKLPSTDFSKRDFFLLDLHLKEIQANPNLFSISSIAHLICQDINFMRNEPFSAEQLKKVKLAFGSIQLMGSAFEIVKNIIKADLDWLNHLVANPALQDMIATGEQEDEFTFHEAVNNFNRALQNFYVSLSPTVINENQELLNAFLDQIPKVLENRGQFHNVDELKDRVRMIIAELITFQRPDSNIEEGLNKLIEHLDSFDKMSFRREEINNELYQFFPSAENIAHKTQEMLNAYNALIPSY